ncbi:MAG: glycosyltransferase, partial [Bacteroidales bacterium]|nr:glycosyltransferase [Bacteroidales bacterium]
MGFADAYLLKAGLREALIEPEPHPGLKISVIIPVFNESGLERCLDSLFQCSCGASGGEFHAEVLILINAPADVAEEVLKQNYATQEAALAWIENHPHPFINFHVMLDHSFGKKEAGVGMARKILMDEAVRRFSLLDRP